MFSSTAFDEAQQAVTLENHKEAPSTKAIAIGSVGALLIVVSIIMLIIYFFGKKTGNG